jgi:hypothetical protein
MWTNPATGQFSHFALFIRFTTGEQTLLPVSLWMIGADVRPLTYLNPLNDPNDYLTQQRDGRGSTRIQAIMDKLWE